MKPHRPEGHTIHAARMIGMTMSGLFILFCMVICMFASPAFAADKTWTTDVSATFGSNNWNYGGTGTLGASDTGHVSNTVSTATITLATTNSITGLILGDTAGSYGVLTENTGGALTATTEYIGYNGTGTFNQNAGTNSVTNMYVGTNSGSSGSYTVSGGTNTVSSTLYIGQNTGASGTYTLNGSGTLNAANMNVNYGIIYLNAGTFSSTGSVTVGTSTANSGSLSIGSTTGTKTFTNLTINSGGCMNFGAAEDVTVNGNFTNNGTLTGTTGAWTFQKSGGGGTLGGSTATTLASATFTTGYTNSGTFSIGTITVTATTLTNNATMSATTALNGTGTFVQGSSATLNIGGTVGISTLNASASGNIVNYNGSTAQTVKTALSGTYSTLKINNAAGATLAGATTLTNLTIGDATTNSIFSDGGFTVTPSGTSTLTMTSGTYKVNTSAFPTFTNKSLAAGTTIEYASSGAQTVSTLGGTSYQNLATSTGGTKTLGGTITVAGNVSIGTGSTLSTSANNYGINVAGTWANNGNFTANSGTVTLNGTGNQTISGTTTFNTLVLNSRSTGSVDFTGSNTIGSLTVNTGAYAVTLTGPTTISGTTGLSFGNSGGVTFGNGDSDVILFSGNTSSVNSTTTLNGTVRTTGNKTLTLAATTLSGTSTLDTTNNSGTTTGANIQTGAITGAGNYLFVDAGTGGTFGATGAVDNTAIVLSRSNGATFGSTVGAGTAKAITIAASNTGTIAFQGDTNISTLTVGAGSYAITFTGSANAITGSSTLTFSNTGGVTFGDNNLDSITFSGQTTSTASTTNVFGTIKTAGMPLTLGATTLGTASTLDTTNGGLNAAGGNLIIGSISNASARDLTLNAGTSGTISVTGAVGSGTALGTITIANAAPSLQSTFSNTVNAAGYTQSAGSFTFSNSATFSGNVTLNGGAFIAPGASKTLSIGGNFSNANAFSNNAGTVTLNGAGSQTLTGATTFNNLNINARSTGTVDLQASTTISNLNVYSGAYAVSLTGSAINITGNGDLTFNNSGGVTFGDNGDAINFSGNTTSTASTTTVNGTVKTVGGKTLTLGATTIGGTSTLDTTNGGTNPGGAALALTTIGNSVAQALTLNAGSSGTLSVTGAVGSGTALGALTVSNASTGTFGSTVNAASYTQSAGNIGFADSTTLSGALTLNGGTLTGTGSSKTFSLGSISITAGSFDVGANTVSVSGATSVSGTLKISSTTGTKTFNSITINTGGSMAFTAAEDIAVNGNLQVDGTGAITGTQGTWTFQKAGGGGTVSGTAPSTSLTNATFTTSYTNSGTFSIGALAINGSGTILTNNGILSASSLTGTGKLLQGTGSTLTLAGNTNTITTLDASTNANTVNYTSSSAQNVLGINYSSLGFSGDSTKTLQGSSTVSGSLTVTGGTVDIGANTLNVAGATSISGTLTISSTTGTKTLGAVTVNNGGFWNNSGNEDVTIRGNLANSGTFTAGSGIYTFDTNSSTLTGTLSIPNVTVNSVTLTNSGSLTVSSSLTGTGTLKQAASSTLYITFGGALGSLTLDAATNPNWVYYNGTAGQTIKAVDYSGLAINNTAGATLSGTTPNVNSLAVGNETANSIFNDGGYSLTAVSGAQIWIQNSSTYKLGTPTTATTLPGFDTWHLDAGTTIEYAAGVAQNVSATPTYANLTLSGTSIKSLTGSTTVANNLSVNSGTLSAGSNALYVGGNWDSSGGVFDYGTSEVIFNGATAQNLTTPASGDFWNNKFNNLTVAPGASVTVTSERNFGIAGTLTINGTFSTGSKTVSVGTFSTLDIGSSGNLAGYILYKYTKGSATDIDTDGLITISHFKYLNTSGLSGDAPVTARTYGDATHATNMQIIAQGSAGTLTNCVIGLNQSSPSADIKGTLSMYTEDDNQTSAVYTKADLTLGGLEVGRDGSTYTARHGNFYGYYQTTNPTIDVNGDVMIAASNSPGTNILYAGTGSFTVSGSWTNNDSFSPGSGTVSFDGSGAQTLKSGGTGTGKAFNNLVHSGSGTLTVSTYDLDINGSFTNSGGVFNDGGRTVYLSGNFTNSGTATYTATGTIDFDGTAQTINGASTFYRVTVDSSQLDIASTTVTVANTLTVNAGKTLNLDNASDNLTLTSNRNAYIIANYGTITQSAGSLTLTSGTNAYHNLDNYGTYVLSGGTLNVSTAFNNGASGTTDSTLTIHGGAATFGSMLWMDWNTSGTPSMVMDGGTLTTPIICAYKGTIDHSAGTITLQGIASGTMQARFIDDAAGAYQGTGNALLVLKDSAYFNISSVNTYFNDVEIAAGTLSATSSISTGSEVDLDVRRHFTIDASSTFDTNGMAMSVGGDWTNNGSFYADSGTVTFDGSGTQTVISGGSANPFGGLTHSGSGTLQLSTDDVVVNGELRLEAGTFKQNTSNLTVKDDFTINNGADFQKGSAGATLTFAGNLTITDLTSGTKKNLGDVIIGSSPDLVELGSNTSYTSVLIKSTDELQTNGYDMDVTNGITISTGGTLDAGDGTGGSSLINVGGDWANAGDFQYGTSTVTLDHTTSGTVSGSTTFYNLTIDSSAGAKTVSFEAGSTQEVLNTLTLDGSAGKVITLLSTSDGDPWYLTAPTGTTGSYLAIKDSVSSTVIVVTNSTNLGGNTNWDFTDNWVVWTGGTSTDWATASNWNIGVVPSQYDNVKIDKTGSYNPALDDDRTTNNLEITSGDSLDDNGKILTVTGNWTNAGSFTASRELILDGAGSQEIDTGGTGSGKAFNDLTHSGSGTATLLDDIKIAGTFNNTGGEFDLNGNDMYVAGDWNTQTVGSVFTAGTGTTVTFDGSGTQTMFTGGTGAGNSFYNVTHSGSGTLLLAGSALDLEGAFTNSDGTFDMNNQPMYVAGNFDNENGLIDRPGTITMDGGNATLTTGGTGSGKDLGNMKIDSSGTITLGGALKMTNLYIYHGTFDDDTYAVTATDNEFIGYGPSTAGTYNQTGGSNTADAIIIGMLGGSGTYTHTAGTTTLSVGLAVGYNGSGSYSLSDTGDLDAAAEYIGYLGGSGTFTQTGGENETINLSVGYGPGSSGSYSLSDGAITATTVIVGDYGATGTFTQSGGTHTAGTLYLGSYTAEWNEELQDYDYYYGTGDYYLSGGTLDVTDIKANSEGSGTLTIVNTPAINVSGDWDFSTGVLSAGSSTVTFTDTGSQTLDSGGTANAFYNLSHNGSGTLTILNNDVQLNGTFNNTAGTVDANGQAIYVAGDWDNAASFDPGTGTVVMNGTSIQYITTNGTGAGKAFYNLSIGDGVSASSVVLNADQSLEVTNNLDIEGNSTFTIAVGTSPVDFIVGGMLSVTGVDAGHLAQLAITGDEAFDVSDVSFGAYGSVVYSRSTESTHEIQPWDYTNALLINTNSGTTTTGQDITCAFFADVVGTFSLDGQTLTVEQGAGGDLGPTTLIGMGGILTLHDSTLTTGKLQTYYEDPYSHTKFAGSLISTGDDAITVSGDWDTTTGTFTAGSSTVAFTGGDAAISTGTAAGAKTFHDVAVNTTGTKELAGDMIVDGNLSIFAGAFSTAGYGLSGGAETVITLGSTGQTASFDMTGSAVSVHDFTTPDVGEDGRVSVTIGAGSTLTVAGDLNLYSGTHGGCVGSEPNTTLTMDQTAQVIMTGSGTYTAAKTGGSDELLPAMKNMSAATEGNITTITRGLDTYTLTLGAGTLSGASSTMQVTIHGTGTPFTHVYDTVNEKYTSYVNIAVLAYMPEETQPTVNVAAGAFNNIGIFGLGNGTNATTLSNADYVLTGIIGESLASAPNTISIGTANAGSTTYKSILDMNGYAMTAKETINVGYDVSPYIALAQVTAGDEDTRSASLTAGTLIKVWTGSTLTMTGSSTLAVGDVSGIGSGALRVGTGGTLLIDGSLSATGKGLVVDDGGTLGGSGTLSGLNLTVQNTGIISPGSSPGIITLENGTATLGPAGVLQWEVADAAGSAGTGWDQWVALNSTITVTATSGDPFQIELYGWNSISGSRGDPDFFDIYSDYTWLILSIDDTSIINGFSIDKFNITSYVSGAPSGNFYLEMDSNGINLNYGGVTPVPEPATIVSIIAGALMALYRRLYKRKRGTTMKPRRSITQFDKPHTAFRWIALSMGMLTILTAIVLAMTPPLFAADKTWNGGAGNWETSGSWSPAGEPTASDTASITTGTVTITEAGAEAGTLNVRSGTLDIDDGTGTWLSVTGNMSVTPTAGGATVAFTGGTGDIDIGGNLMIGPTGSYVATTAWTGGGGDVTVGGDLTIREYSTGSTTFSSGTGTYTVHGTYSNANTDPGDVVWSSGSTLHIDSDTSQTLPANTYQSVILDRQSTSGTTTYTAGGDRTFQGDLIIGADTTFAASTNAITVGGDYSNSGTLTFSAGADAKFVFTGSNNTITAGGTGSDKDFYQVELDSSGTLTLGSSAKINYYLRYFAGDLIGGSYTVEMNNTINTTSPRAYGYAGEWKSGTLLFSEQDVASYWYLQTPNSTEWYNVTINTANQQVYVNTEMDVNGDLSLTSGKISGAHNINVAGDVTVGAGWVPVDESITLDGTDTQTISVAGTFPDNLTINKSAGEAQTAQDLDVSGTLTVTAGTLSIGAHTLGATTFATMGTLGTVKLEGNNTIDITYYATPTAGTWEYTGDGIGTTVTIKDFGTNDYFNIKINDPTGLSTFQLGTNDLDVGGTFTVSGGTFSPAGRNVVIDGNLVLNGGTYDQSSGTTTVAGSTTVGAGSSIVVNGIMTGTETMTISAGGMLSGNGTIQALDLILNSGGIISPGNSPGTITFDGGTQTWNAGSILKLEIYDAGAAAGGIDAWDLWHMINSAELTIGSGIILNVYGLNAGGPGTPIDFPAIGTPGSWLFVDNDGGVIAGFDPSDFIINLHDFDSQYAASAFYVSSGADGLYLNFDGTGQVPEPGTLVSVIAGVLLAFSRKLYKRKATRRMS